ncbi:MAG: hypothetical protein U1E97_10795 [Alphaproteobacteria bacterium]
MQFGIATTTPPGDHAITGGRRLDAESQTDGAALYTAIPGHQIRRLAIETSLEKAARVADDAGAIVAVDYRTGGTAERPTRSFVTSMPRAPCA